MSVNVDTVGLLADLEQREGYSLPFEVRSVGRVGSREAFAAAVNEAIDAANRAATTRVPDDPTWSTSGDLTPKAVIAEIQKGTMEAGEIASWLGDLGSALSSLHCQVLPHVPPKRVPNWDRWEEKPFAPTAFLQFTAPDSGAGRWKIDVEVLEALWGVLIPWARLPSGEVIVTRGLQDFPASRGDLPEVLLEGMPSELPEVTLREVNRDAWRMRQVRLSDEAWVQIQAVDPRRPVEENLAAVLEAVRPLARYLDYGYLRLARPSYPDTYDRWHLRGGSPGPDWERFERDRRVRHLMTSRVPSAYVAQVLTSEHLAGVPDLPDFEVEEVAPDRFLVVAHDTAPWLSQGLPDPGVEAAARDAFGPLVLTQEFAAAHPPPWLR